MEGPRKFWRVLLRQPKGEATSAHSAAYAVKPYAAGHTAHGTVIRVHRSHGGRMQ